MPVKTVYKPEPVKHVQVLDENGKVDKNLEPKVPKEDLLRLYETMVLSREFDFRRLRLQRQGRIGTFAPAHGQEASMLGTIYCTDEDDWFVPSFRETPCYMWRGARLENDLLYCAGFEEGMAIPDEARVLPICIPIGTQYTHALGLAWAQKRKGTDRLAIVYGGDGSTSEGDFHEAANMAAVYQSPVLFVIQNNQWAISVPRARQSASKTLAQKAIAYEIPNVQVDGNDILGVIKVAKDAVEHIRSGKGPYLIETLTYRMNVHTTADDPKKYRSKDEEQEWAKRDPIDRFRKYLTAKRWWNQKKEDEMQERIKKTIDKAVKRFEERKKELAHDALGIFNHAYLELPPYLERQKEELARHYEEEGGAKTEEELHAEAREVAATTPGGN